MKRRELLKLGAAATAATAGTTLGGPGCGTLPRALEGMAGVPSPESYLAMLDRQLPVVDQADFVDRFVTDKVGGARSPDVTAAVAERDALFRRMLRSLLISQSFRDLPLETQLHPAVQERMMGHLEEVSGTVFAVSDMLASQGDDVRAGVRRALAEDPDLPMTISATIDRHASAAGISMKRRLQLRRMMSHSAFRMRNSDPGVVIDEYVARIERYRPHGDKDPEALDLAQRLGERAFWRYQKQLAAQGRPSGPPGAQAAPAAPTAPTAGAAASSTIRWPLITGAWTLGLGVVTFAASLAVVETSDVALLGITFGALSIAVGFVFLIIGAILYARSRPA
jgi:hypothetical protein